MKFSRVALIVGCALSLVAPAVMADSRIGFVNSDRVMRESTPAVQAQQRLEKEFSKRDGELQNMAKELQGMKADLEKNGLTLSASDRSKKEREFSDLNRDFQRRQREFREDLNQRRNEELATVLDRANKAVKAIAEREKYDIIFQEAVYASPAIDITDKVIKELDGAK
ncbi:OmpH family outer membrane protein [Nitrogeniibacter mangrovi]|uniref:OmpH family outer membrane protein n=1 Tax=Nitrogeniibacter mangrovi TaxID=2016596 RepID=A0A6C1B701_9RHOO|nr:OmpH family outer membrane protein [Nitrogeniibacter mangrovi]QID18024.1 OmpH family outer membrane protein [Nitrogeniibacter mangrovi]